VDGAADRRAGAAGAARRALRLRTRAPEGESLLDATLRAVRWLGALPEDDTTLVVAHGGVLRGLLGVVDGLDVGEIPRRIVDNATVNLRELDAGDWARALERLEAAPPGPG
jgi:broad specificity phosphatase PhoE